MKKLMFAISLFGFQLVHAEILSNVAPIGNFVPSSAGLEIVVPYWTKTKVAVPLPNGTGSVNLANGGTIQFKVFKYNTNTLLPSPPSKSFPNPNATCGVSQFNQGENSDAPKFVKTSGNVFTVGRNMNCQMFDASGNPIFDTSGNIQELNYSYVYIADLATNNSWIVTSKKEELVGIDVVPDQNGNGSEELVLSFHSGLVRVLVLDSTMAGTIADKTLSNKTYSIGNPD